jgi:hypothetical protein
MTTKIHETDTISLADVLSNMVANIENYAVHPKQIAFYISDFYTDQLPKVISYLNNNFNKKPIKDSLVYPKELDVPTIKHVHVMDSQNSQKVKSTLLKIDFGSNIHFLILNDKLTEDIITISGSDPDEVYVYAQAYNNVLSNKPISLALVTPYKNSSYDLLEANTYKHGLVPHAFSSFLSTHFTDCLFNFLGKPIPSLKIKNAA